MTPASDYIPADLPDATGPVCVVTASPQGLERSPVFHPIVPAQALAEAPCGQVVLVDTRDMPGQLAALIAHFAALDFSGLCVLLTPFLHLPIWMRRHREPVRSPDVEKHTRLAELVERVLIPAYLSQTERPFAKPILPALVGISPAIERVRERLPRIIEHDRATVLIRGSSGTGKQVIARGIHDLGPRAGKPFVEVNCTALPEELLEAELFGRERGAYTGAHTSRRGLIETAADGTLFLDEIGHVSEKLQMALLKVIEQRTFRRVGGTDEKMSHARFIAATSRNLEEAMSAGAFRSELYYRLNVLSIILPDLHERDADVLLLAQYYARRYAREYGHPLVGMTGEAALILLGHRWPGNVRELKNLVERAVVFSDEIWLDASAFALEGQLPIEGVAREEAAPSLSVDPSGAIKVTIPPWGLPLSAVERAVIEAALKASSYNVSKAAKLLFISRDTLRYRMKKYGLKGSGGG